MTKTSFYSLLAGFCVFSCACADPVTIEPGKPGGGNTGIDKPGDTVVEPVPGEPEAAGENNPFAIVGIDQFGRAFDAIDGFRADRQVGMFYWPWIGQPYASGIYDATKIAALPNGLDILTDFDSLDENISPNGQAHYWGEPIWGYYNSIDEWVIRKQMEMITLAGVDFIFFDHTNAIIYTPVVMNVCKVISEMIKEGWDAPKIVSYTHSRSFQTLRTLYSEIYKPMRYPETWYYHKGKPLVIAYTDPADDLAEAASRGDSSYDPGILSAEILDFFTFFKPNWPFDPTYPDGFTWVEWKFPQPLHTESQMMNVTVASHPRVPMSFSLTRPGWINWGRGWDPLLKQNISENVDKGTFFQAQWDEALKVDPPMISVGGWNEWIAYKQPFDGEYMLCDAASKEYSRDIEPMVGGYQDAFYFQLIDNIRRYKGIRNEDPAVTAPKTIDINEALSQWSDVGFVQRKADSKQMARDEFGGSQTVRYTQAAPSNAISEVRVSYDAEKIYFYIKTKSKLTEPKHGETNWMNLFIGRGKPSLKGWESFEYLVGSNYSDGKVSVEVLDADYGRSYLGEVAFTKVANYLQIEIPRALIGLDSEETFYFKLASGVETPSDIMSYYKTGSVLPIGRLCYQFNL